MGDWRHSGERMELAAALQEFGRPESPCALPCTPEILLALDPLRAFAEVPGPFPDDLARLVESEILPRLMLAHREPAPIERLRGRQRPSPDQIARFCTLLLAPSGQDVAPHVLGLLDEGVSVEGLLLDLLTPAARHLGTLWEEDECDFVQVTLGLNRLQTVARDLCGLMERDGLPEHGRRVLLAGCPQETHLFGLALVASFFRDAGWAVSRAESPQAVEIARDEWFDVIGLTLSCEVFLPAMAETIAVLRKVSRNPGVRILVGGSLFLRQPEQVARVGADATAADGRLAPKVAESLLEMRTRAC